ncbi:MAG: iron ABC transporter permease [Solirubrobacteraceae bacterium]|nr:iron ABC transporter permease [Solirubrobacteraceae bacterium]
MRSRHSLVLAAGLAVLVLSFLASLAFGAVALPIKEVARALAGGDVSGQVHEIAVGLRLPRTASAAAVGAALAVAGVLLQGALANPLASPDVIGVTGGAGFGATLILLAFPDQAPLVPLGALIFGLVAAGIVLTLGSAGPRGGSIERVVLAGIAIAALFGAATTSLMVAYPDRVSSAIGFLAGGLVSDGWSSLETSGPYLAAGFVGAVLLARPLDRLSLGDDLAASLGTSPRRTRLLAGIAAAALAAAAASIAGLLGFLGLIVPHLVRLAAGTATHRFLIPACAIVGAAVLLLGDTLARTVVAPIELPVGPLMVVLGVPWFLWLLRKTA